MWLQVDAFTAVRYSPQSAGVARGIWRNVVVGCVPVISACRAVALASVRTHSQAHASTRDCIAPVVLLLQHVRNASAWGG